MPRAAPRHRPAAARSPDGSRGTAAARGYGYRWQKYRLSFLRRHPLCAVCDAPATDVDHRLAVNGPHDPLFWDATNHQPLCHACHSRKTATEDRGLGRPHQGGGPKIPASRAP